jgi:hypothetical protein
MKVATSRESLTCSECGSQVNPALYKVQGQSNYKCTACISREASMSGPEKNLTLDGINQFVPDPEDESTDG